MIRFLLCFLLLVGFTPEDVLAQFPNYVPECQIRTLTDSTGRNPVYVRWNARKVAIEVLADVSSLSLLTRNHYRLTSVVQVSDVAQDKDRMIALLEHRIPTKPSEDPWLGTFGIFFYGDSAFEVRGDWKFLCSKEESGKMSVAASALLLKTKNNFATLSYLTAKTFLSLAVSHWTTAHSESRSY